MSQKSQKPRTQSIELINLNDSLEDFKIQPRKLRKTKSSQEISKTQIKSVSKRLSSVKDSDFKGTQSSSSLKTRNDFKLPEAADQLNTVSNDTKLVKKVISETTETSQYWEKKSLVSRSLPVLEKLDSRLNEILATKDEDYKEIQNSVPESVACLEIKKDETTNVEKELPTNVTPSPSKETPAFVETKASNVSISEVLKEVDPPAQSPCPICDKVVNDLTNHIKICCIGKFSFTKKNDNGIICGIQYDASNSSNGSKKEVKRETCSICEKDITHMTKQRRLQHVNRCADEIPTTVEKLREMTFICPFCGVNNDTSQSLDNHLKLCGKKLNSQPEALKETAVTGAEKKQPKKPAKKKKRAFQSASPKNLEEAELQMAMALSASLQEEQNCENSAPEINPFEVENQETDRARFSNLFSGAILPPPKAKGRKKKPVKIYKLATQTEVERSRQLQWKVSELLEGQFNSSPVDDLNWHETANKCKLWVLSALKANLTREDFYIDDLIERIESDKMSLSFKPRHKHLSQIAGRHSFGCTANVSKVELDETGPVIISTPSLTQRQTQFLEDGDDTLGGFLSQNSEVSSLKRKISSDYSKMVGKEDFSDAKILTVDGEIPVHLIIISVRCPKLLEEFDNERNLDLKESNQAAVLAFLEFVYTGECNFDASILEDLKKLAIKYEQNDLLKLLNQKSAHNEIVAVEEEEEEEEDELYQLANQTLHKIIHSVWDEPPNSSKIDEKITKDCDDWNPLLNSNIVISLSQFVSQTNNEDDLKIMSEVSDNEERDSFQQDREESMDLSDCKGNDDLKDERETNGQRFDWKESESFQNLRKNANLKDNLSFSNSQSHLDESFDLPNIVTIPELRVESNDGQDTAIDLHSIDRKSQRSDEELINNDEKVLSGDGDSTLFHQRNSPETITICSSSSEANTKDTLLYKSDDLSKDFQQLSTASPDGSFLLKHLLEKTKEILSEGNTSNVPIDEANTGTKNESNLSLKDRLKNGYYNVVPQSPSDDFPDFKKNSKIKSPRFSPVKKISPKGKSPATTPTTGIWLNKKYGETTPIKTFGLRNSSSRISPELIENKVETSKKILFPNKDDKQKERNERVSSPDIFASDYEDDDNVECPSTNTSLETIKFVSEKNTPAKELANCSDSPECLVLTSPETPLPLVERLKKCGEIRSSSVRLKRVLIQSPKNVKRTKNEPETELDFMDLPDVDGLSPFSEENDGILPLPTNTRRILESADDARNLNTKGKWKDTEIRPSSTQPEKSKLSKNNARVTNSQPVRKKNIATPPVTPMPDYKTMITPELKNALKKVGVKPLPRSKAVPLLTRIYDDTHPYVCDDDVFPSTSQMPMPPPDIRKKKKAPLVLNTSSDSEFSSSQESNSSSGGAEVLEESIIDESQGVNELDYKSKLKHYIKSNPELHTRILTYEPIPLKEFYETIRLEGIKLTMSTLMDFLDEQCITFTLPRSDKQKVKQQRRQKRFKDRIKAK